MEFSTLDHVVVAIVAVGAGLVNAVAGGGTLITFPTLVALGMPSVESNITSKIALCPGYFGGTVAQRRDLTHQRQRVRSLSAVSVVGGLLGSILLVLSPEDLFEVIVPFLLFVSCGLMAFQERLRRLVPLSGAGGHDRDGGDGHRALLSGGVFVAAVYGGYFGAGLGIILLATLGLLVDDTLAHLNALRQAISLITNVVAALFFVFSGDVVWTMALVMAPAALLGGAIGGRLASTLNPRLMRAVVIVIGLVVGFKYLVDLIA